MVKGIEMDCTMPSGRLSDTQTMHSGRTMESIDMTDNKNLKSFQSGKELYMRAALNLELIELYSTVNVQVLQDGPAQN
jgi:hypothetical protein